MRISIPKPCNENWNEMTPEQQGAFCKVCSKVVVDFSKMSDEEVIAYLEKKKEEKTCGRFKASQLSPYELKIDIRNIVTKGSFPKIFAASLFIFFSSLFVCKSDTGDNIIFNKVTADAIDTATVILRADSTTTQPAYITGEAPMKITLEDVSVQTVEGLVDIEQEPVIIDTSIVAPADTTSVIDLPMMGIIYREPDPEPMIKGKIACTRPTKTENEKINKKKQAEKKRKNDREIMGDVLY